MLEIVRLFGRLGLLGFGGPVAAMAMMEEEACRKRGWVSPERFREIYAICKILPGPVATQMAIHLGYLRAGRSGGSLAGVLFILPALLIVLGLAYVYRESGAAAGTFSGLAGMQAGALAVIALSTFQLARPYHADRGAWAIALATGALVLVAPRWEPLVIIGFGAAGVIRARGAKSIPRGFGVPLAWGSLLPIAAAQGTGTLGDLAWVCFKAGAFVFGTGLAIIPILETDVVARYAWLTHSQFMDALAVGQVTPGPVTITATFIGFQAFGWPGAAVATLGIFLPAFVNMLFILPRLWNRLNGTPAARGFAAWAIPSVVGGIAAAAITLGRATITSPAIGALALAAFALAARFSVPAWLLIPGCGVAEAIARSFSLKF